MIKIGTRTLISIDGKLVIATHWDGYPSSLGLDLLWCDKSLKDVVEVAKRHMVDSADTSILKELKNERVKKLAKKHRLTEAEISVNGVKA